MGDAVRDGRARKGMDEPDPITYEPPWALKTD